jgi:hypothetical protein
MLAFAPRGRLNPRETREQHAGGLFRHGLDQLKPAPLGQCGHRASDIVVIDGVGNCV